MARENWRAGFSGAGRRTERQRLVRAGLVACCILAVQTASGAAPTPDPPDSIDQLKKLSVDQLFDVEITSVSRAPERFAGAAAAVSVVTNEDLRRSGASSVPEALRMVPGLFVARQTSNTWAISSRGFSSISSEKLLVLSDTRSIYTPLFAGVLWDVQDYLLQDIDRIEVIRGPGATLWGSNAVNGVINITTKSAKDTQGVYAESSAGTEDRAAAAARYGGTLGDHGYYRVFGTFFDRGPTFHPAGVNSDDWQMGHVGGRTDWAPDDNRSLTLQGDFYGGSIGRLAPSILIMGRPSPTGPLDVDASGGNVLGRYQRRLSPTSQLDLRVYYDRTHRNDPSFVDDLHTFDAELQHRFAAAGHQEVTWGITDRVMLNRNVGKGVFRLDPEYSRDNLASGFVQDQFTIRPSVRLTAGTKLEHNDFSGFEVQPSLRLAWDLAENRTLWGAVSRAVRVPTRLERDVDIDTNNPAAPVIGRLLGNSDFDSEKLVAYEAGYRWQVSQPLSVGVATFHNRYTGLASLELDTPFADARTRQTIVPIRNQNLTDGHTQGVEITASTFPRTDWRVTTTYAYLDITLDPHGRDLNRGQFFDGATPKHQVTLQSFVDLPAHVQLDGQFRALGALRRLPSDSTGAGIPAYAEADLRVAWRGWRRMELSIVGQNLLHAHHVEFGAADQRGEIQRGVYAKIAWGF